MNFNQLLMWWSSYVLISKKGVNHGRFDVCWYLKVYNVYIRDLRFFIDNKENKSIISLIPSAINQPNALFLF